LKRMKFLVLPAFLLLLALAALAGADEPVSPLRKLSLVSNDPQTPAAQRIVRGVAFLREELAAPTPRQWVTGLSVSRLDTGVMQGNLVLALGMVGMEAREALRGERDRETSPHLRKLLTLALGFSGDREAIPSLLKAARSEEQGPVRAMALLSLALFLKQPQIDWQKKRLAPGEVWRPVGAETKKDIERAFLASLNDPYEQYLATCVTESVEYPVRREAVSGLRALGYALKIDRTGQSLLMDDKGRSGRQVQVRRAPEPRDLPSGVKPRPAASLPVIR
jgi:hypothetical protein